MGKPYEIGPGLFVVAGPDLTDGRDALAYLVEAGGDLALIDAGAGPSYKKIVGHIRGLGLYPERLRYVIATHAHIDHIGALADFAADYSPVIVAHALDAEAIETGDPARTAADWYGLTLAPVRVDRRMEGRQEILELGGTNLVCRHTPGHTPGSLVVYLDREGKRYLFGQDIHGPFDAAFGSDVAAWRESMQSLLELGADVLGEGHYGVFHGAAEVRRFIRGFLDRE
ncbi:MAG: MBL fold metallo-hydrolase [Thermodesulfobacteriota bacterium]